MAYASLEQLVEDLSARIVANEAIVLEDIPSQWRDEDAVARVLKLARISQNLSSNRQPVPDEAAPRQIGPWRVLRRLGSGGMGDVWLCERSDAAAEQKVAVKSVRSASLRLSQRLHQERRILAKLNHPNVARFIDAGLDDAGFPWMALDYVEGVPITEWCEQHALALEARVRLLIDVCDAVSHAHQHLIVHRDLKPNNLFVEHTGTVKLLDFGISKLLDECSDNNSTANALTPSYAAPEQLLSGEISTATDIYALGLLMFRLLAGVLPPSREERNLSQILAALDAEETSTLSAGPQTVALPYLRQRLRGDLDAIVFKAMRLEPALRYASADAMAEDLRRFLAQQPVHARAPTRRYRWSKWAQRNRLGLALGTSALVALLVGSGVALWQAQRAQAAAADARAEADRAARELTRAERITSFLASLFREQDPLARNISENRTPKQLLAQAAARVEPELASEPQVAAQLLRVLGESQLNLGDGKAAEATLLRARALSEGVNDLALGAEIDALLAQWAMRELRHDDADRLFAQALSAAEQVHGPQSVEAARIDSKRALSLVILARFADARAAAERADELLAAGLPATDPERIQARTVLAIVLEQLREDAGAEVAARSAIEAIEQAFGDRDGRLARPLLTRGEILRRAQNFDEARLLLARSVRVARERFGEPHGMVVEALVRLASVERDAGDNKKAIAALVEAEAALPAGDANLRAQLLATRGGTYLELGDGARAEVDLREALRLRRETGGLKTGLAWFSQAQLGEALMLRGRLEEAHALQAEAAIQLRKLLGPDAYQNALIAQRWAKTHEARRDFVGAAAQWREAARLIEKTYGSEHFGYLDMSSRLAAALAKNPRSRAEALTLSESLLASWPKHAADQASLGRIAALRALSCQLGRADRCAAAADDAAPQ